MRLVPGGTATGWGTWSPDGRRITYSGGDTLYVQDLDDPRGTVVAHGDNLHSPAWSPDGRMIAYRKGSDGSLTRASMERWGGV